MPEAARGALTGASLAIWTTTPWTLPANLAVAVNWELTYSVVEVDGGGGSGGSSSGGWAPARLVVAAELAPALAAKWGVGLRTLATLTGEQLAGCTYRHPLAAFDRWGGGGG